jgi:hypothetical protein
VRSASLVGLFAMLLAQRAAASPPGARRPSLTDALARHGAADVAALRGHRDDVAARCTLGAIYARRNDLPRAALYLAACADATLPDDVARAVRRIALDVKHRLEASRLAAIDVVTEPSGLRGEIDALPGDPFTTPATIWVAAGEHEVRVVRDDRTWSRRVATEPRKNTVIVIDTARSAKPAARSKTVDFADDGAALGERVAAPPPDIKHPSLMTNRYRGIPDPPAEPPIDDPLGPRAPRRPAPRARPR